jgi:hypothetical protein
MLMPMKQEMELTPDLLHQARHFRTVLASFSRNVDLLFERHQPAPTIDSVAMATAFANWRETFDATRHLADINRNDFVIFSAGALLGEMLNAKPLATAPATVTGLSEVGLERWPEGFAYTNFCLSMAAAVRKGMGAEVSVDERRSMDPAFWNSFRENVAENPRTAAGFFDMLCGIEPNWNGPDILWFRPGFQTATEMNKPEKLS